MLIFDHIWPRELPAHFGAQPASQETEGGVEGPHRFVFDLETISQHENAAGAKSEGLTLGTCCDYHKGKPVLLCDLEFALGRIWDGEEGERGTEKRTQFAAKINLSRKFE